MPAMTMPYEVQMRRQLDGIAPGDLINAKLVVFSNDAYLTDIKKVGKAPLEKPPAETRDADGVVRASSCCNRAKRCPTRQVPRSGRQDAHVQGVQGHAGGR